MSEFNIAKEYGIPIVMKFEYIATPKELITYIKGLSGAEGVVISWDDGQRVKIKADEYVAIHRAKEAILQDRNILDLILREKLDDVLAHLDDEDRAAIEKFSNDINTKRIAIMTNIQIAINNIINNQIDRKNFALNMASRYDNFTKSIIFSVWGNNDIHDIKVQVDKTIKNNLTKNIRWENLRDVWFTGIVYNQ